MNYLHIYGIFLRNMMLLRRSFPRLFGLFYWVTVELFFWGFITVWVKDIAGDNTKVDFVLILLTALIFWDLFHRIQQSVSIGFLEDIWARNVMNIFASPIKPWEFVAGLISLSIVQGIIAFVYVTVLAFILYALQIWTLGFYIIPLFLNMFIFGWALGLIAVALILRFGPSVEILVWSIPFLFLPFSAVYYSVDVFPQYLQTIAFFIPTSHLFEGMRSVFNQETFQIQSIIWATILNIFYFAAALGFFYWMLRVARKRGLIARLLTD